MLRLLLSLSFVVLGISSAGASEIFHVSDYGALPDDGEDDRAGIQAALDAAAASGGIVQLDPGVYRIVVTYLPPSYFGFAGFHGIAVPEGCTLRGEGAALTTLRLSTTWPDTAGVGNGIVNRNYNTSRTDFGGDGNLVLSDFKIEADNLTSWTTGNLIGLGHGHDSRIERVELGMSRFHGVELNRCRDIVLRDCEFTGEHQGTASLQFDVAAMGAVSDNVPNPSMRVQDITVERCRFTGREKETKGGMVIELSHSEYLHLKRVRFSDCYIDGLDSPGAAMVAFSNPQPSDVEGILFERCTFNGRHTAGCAHGMLYLNFQVPGLMKDVTVRDCVFQGMFWQGIVIGSTDYFFNNAPERRQNIVIENNTFRPVRERSSAQFMDSNRMICAMSCTNVSVRRNVIEYPDSDLNFTTNTSLAIQCMNNLSAEISDNVIVWKHRAGAPQTPPPSTWFGIYAQTWQLEAAGIPATVRVTGNQFAFHPGSLASPLVMNSAIPVTSWAPGAPWVTGLIAGNYATAQAQNPNNTWLIWHDLSGAGNVGQEAPASPQLTAAAGWYSCNGAPLTALDLGNNQVARLNARRLGMTTALPSEPGRMVRLHGPMDGAGLLAPHLARFQGAVWKGAANSAEDLVSLPFAALINKEVRFVRSARTLYQWQKDAVRADAGPDALEPADKPASPGTPPGQNDPPPGDDRPVVINPPLPPLQPPPSANGSGFWVRITCDTASLNDDADPDQDGQSNLLEEALLGDPLSAEALPGPEAVFRDGEMKLSFPCAARRDLTLRIESSDDLITWTDLAVSEQGAAFSSQHGCRLTESGNLRREISVSIPEGSTPRQFWRMVPVRAR